MIALLIVLAVLGFCGWLTTEVLPVLEHRWREHNRIATERNAIRARYASIAERQMTLAERQAEKPKRPEPMPADLQARIRGWEDEWAQEDERKAIESLYADLNDWDQVRIELAKLAPGRPVTPEYAP